MRAFLKTLTLNLAVLVFLLGVVELLFGAWLFGPDLTDIGVKRNVHKVLDASSLYPGGERIVYTRDARGLRGEYGHPGGIDILAIGGSTTDELFVSDGKTWLDVLRERFAADGRPQVIVNAAVSGHTSYGHIEAFRRWLPRIKGLRARYVLAYIGINDVMLEKPRKFDDFRLREYQKSSWYMVTSRSALMQLYRDVKNAVLAPRPDVRHGDGRELINAEWLPVTDPPDLEAARRKHADLLAAYHDRLRVLSQLIREFGAEPIFVTQPRGDYRLREGRLFGYRDKSGRVATGGYTEIALFNGETLRSCEVLEVTCIDLANAISFVNGDLYDAMHTTPQGSRRIAETLYPLLAPHIKDRPENLPKPGG